VLEQLAALAKIAEIDAEALRSDNELKEIPERIAEFDNNVRRLGALLAAERVELEGAGRLLITQEGEIQNQSQSLAKSKAKSARARTLRETDAVEKELEVIRRSMKEREEERVNLRAAIEKRRGSLAKHEKELAELERIAAEERQKAEGRIAELRELRERVLTGRRELAATLPAEVLRQYERIRDRKGAGAAAMKNKSCGGCNTALTPNQAVSVFNGDAFQQCARCQRFLFSPESLKAFADAKALED
jgi:hypothetical protein